LIFQLPLAHTIPHNSLVINLLLESSSEYPYFAEKDPPNAPLRELIRRIAMLDGLLARKGDGVPGVKTLWQGFARVDWSVKGASKNPDFV
jgi:hypothetical protein